MNKNEKTTSGEVKPNAGDSKKVIQIVIDPPNKVGECTRISIERGTESIWLDIDMEEATVDICHTMRNGGCMLSKLKFEEDSVEEVEE